MTRIRPLILALGLAFSAGASATTLSGTLTADNGFIAYLSTSDAVLGTQIVDGDNWTLSYSFSGVALTTGTDYYLHVVARDWGRPEAFIGQFTLSDNAFHFETNDQNLLTDTTHWRAADGVWGSWAVPTGAPVDRGVNGVGPWGMRSGISSSAHWIWSENYGSGTTYFSTKITAAVPEPETYAMLLAGLGLMGALARRKRNAA